MRAQQNWVAVAAGIVVLAIPASASAATEIGQVPASDPDVGCTGGGYNLVQFSISSGTTYQVPGEGGVITSWRHRGDVATPGSGRLQLWTPAGGNNYTLLARSELHTFDAGDLNVFPTRIPTEGGELLGIRTVDSLGCGANVAGDNTTRFEMSGAIDPTPGAVRTFGQMGITVRLNVSATLEPDADADGFGDETQDACPGQAGTDNGCVPVPDTSPPNTTITSGPKDKTKKKQAIFEFTGTDARAVAGFLCSLDGGAFAACTSPHTVTVKKGRHTFQVRAVDEAGNVGSSATDTWKRKKKKKK